MFVYTVVMPRQGLIRVSGEELAHNVHTNIIKGWASLHNLSFVAIKPADSQWGKV